MFKYFVQKALRVEFRRPRDTFLHVVAEFLTMSSARLNELNRKTGHENKANELLDTKCHLVSGHRLGIL